MVSPRPAAAPSAAEAAQDLDRLAKPHVVGEAGAQPQLRSEAGASARRPSDRAAASPATPGRDRHPACRTDGEAPSESRPAMDRRRSRSSRRRAGRQSRPRRSPLPPPGAWPRRTKGPRRRHAARSLSKRSSVRPSRSRSISTHRPRMKASPLVSASSFLTSAADSVSPSSVISTRKSSSASRPSSPGGLPPTVAGDLRCAGRPMRHDAGMRTITPAVSSAGTSLRNCRACCGLQRNG